MANGDADFGPDAAPPGGAPPGLPPGGGGGIQPGPGPMGPPPAGRGPILAALARGRQGPQVSAPGPGNFADSITKIGMVIPLLQTASLGFQANSKEAKAVHNAIGQLMKIGGAQQGDANIGPQKTGLMDMLMATIRDSVMPQIMGAKQQAGPGAPMPSTPLPGA